MNKKQKVKKIAKSITIGFLDCLLSIAESFMVCMDRKDMYKVLNGYYDNELTIEKISKHFCDLRRRGYIEVSKDNNSVCFTNKAKLKIVDKIAEKLKTEDKYYFVSFDIPETFRSNRNHFRRTIKRMGFREVQKSLWVCNRNVGELVEIAAEEYKISEYIVYIISDITNINDNIKSLLTSAKSERSSQK